MRIGKDRVVSIAYTIRNESGFVVDTNDGREPLVYLHGHNQIVPGVEAAIEGLAPGATLSVSVAPEQAYGERDPTAIAILPRTAFPPEEDLEAGMMFRAMRPDGRPFLFSILAVEEERIVVDANHPLAGQRLAVDVAVLSVRDATAQELEHGHVHVSSPPAGTSQLPA
jgi:FKBP-type peptidyl-prolyl cis-trans isomerase SlyD